MHWNEDDEEGDFEWKEEDEEEIPAGKGSSLAGINRVATIVFLSLLGLGAVYFVIRMFNAWADYFG